MPSWEGGQFKSDVPQIRILFRVIETNKISWRATGFLAETETDPWFIVYRKKFIFDDKKLWLTVDFPIN